jgi:hypothetical protein
MIKRRGFIAGLVSALAAPAIIRPGLLMPIKSSLVPVRFNGGITVIPKDCRSGETFTITNTGDDVMFVYPCAGALPIVLRPGEYFHTWHDMNEVSA